MEQKELDNGSLFTTKTKKKERKKKELTTAG